MIQWSLSLSHNQIAILSAIKWETDTPASVVKRTYIRIPHFVSGIRLLLAEKLVEYYEIKNFGDDTPVDKGYKITNKGRAILSAIEMEVRDVHQEAEQGNIIMLSPAENPKLVDGNPSGEPMDQLWRIQEDMKKADVSSEEVDSAIPKEGTAYVAGFFIVGTGQRGNMGHIFNTLGDCAVYCHKKNSQIKNDRFYFPEEVEPGMERSPINGNL